MTVNDEMETCSISNNDMKMFYLFLINNLHLILSVLKPLLHCTKYIVSCVNHYLMVASAYFFLGSILITGSAHTDREKVSTKPLIMLIKALNEGLSAILL